MTHRDPVFFERAADFRAWLAQNSAHCNDLLVGFWKVGSGRPSMTWSESVDEALCFGWIDGVRKRIDDHSYQIRFTPRRPGSIWSAVNIAKVESLRGLGKLTPAGEQAFARRTQAKSVVYSYEQPETGQLEATEIKTFKKNKAAWTFFEGSAPSYKKVMVHWITAAKKPETRAHRLAKLISASGRGERLR